MIFACNSTGEKKDSKVSIKEETVTYECDSLSMKGFVAYDESTKAKRPLVMVIHEWWGLNDYTRIRVRQLASLGYIAFAVDMFGDGKTADNPTDATSLSSPFYNNPALAKSRFDAALAKAKSYPEADTSKIALIGYCFGGGMALNIARLGEDLKGVVSFHGTLLGVPTDKNLLKADLLICQGGADKFVSPEQVSQFKHEMDSAGINYTFKSYPDAMHAFSNPNATENGKKFNLPIAYNAAADTASWKDMNEFFGKIFK